MSDLDVLGYSRVIESPRDIQESFEGYIRILSARRILARRALLEAMAREARRIQGIRSGARALETCDRLRAELERI